MKKAVILQCLLCSFLLFVSIVIAFRSNQRASQVGAFGGDEILNDTFENFANNFFEELFNE